MSGLVRYEDRSEFALVAERRHEHVTPRGAVQRFQFAAFRFIGGDEASA